MTGKTISEKILSLKSGMDARAGDLVVCDVDCALGTDGSTPMALDYFDRMGGTAVRHAGGELHRAPNGRPFTSDMSGQDFATLLRAGYRPAGLVMGNCVYHVARQGMLQSLRQMGRNVEMPNFTQALYEARELAMERMQNEADELQSEGIVGARIIERSHGWGSHVIEFFAIGTAVVSTSSDHEIDKPTLVLPLQG